MQQFSLFTFVDICMCMNGKNWEVEIRSKLGSPL